MYKNYYIFLFLFQDSTVDIKYPSRWNETKRIFLIQRTVSEFSSILESCIGDGEKIAMGDRTRGQR